MTPKSRALRLASSMAGQPWDNLELLEELQGRSESNQDSGHWAIWHWQGTNPPPPLLSITIKIPRENREQNRADEFTTAVAFQMERALAMFSDERGWPKPRFSLHICDDDQADWSYTISVSGRSAGGYLKPANLLAVGEPALLCPLLGLETVDPVLGLPAKWIGRSQLRAALASDLHVFDGPGVVATHTLHLLADVCHKTVGFLELQGWLAPALNSHSGGVGQMMEQHPGLLLQTITSLMSEGLWLPHPSRFCEFFLMTLCKFENGESPDFQIFKELIRTEIVPLNLVRFCDRHEVLNAVEWRGHFDGDSAVQSRLMVRLGQALAKVEQISDDGIPVLITDFESRPVLAEVLSGSFPQLPVLSWAEIPSNSRLELQAVVDAAFEVDPSVWTYQAFEVPYSTIGVQDP